LPNPHHHRDTRPLRFRLLASHLAKDDRRRPSTPRLCALLRAHYLSTVAKVSRHAIVPRVEGLLALHVLRLLHLLLALLHGHLLLLLRRHPLLLLAAAAHGRRGTSRLLAVAERLLEQHLLPLLWRHLLLLPLLHLLHLLHLLLLLHHLLPLLRGHLRLLDRPHPWHLLALPRLPLGRRLLARKALPAAHRLLHGRARRPAALIHNLRRRLRRRRWEEAETLLCGELRVLILHGEAGDAL